MFIESKEHIEKLYLSGGGRPDFERVVIRSGDDAIAAELQARYHVVVVSFEHSRRWDGSGAPVHFNCSMAHESCLSQSYTSSKSLVRLKLK